MVAEIISVEQLRDYIGVDSEKDDEIRMLRAAAIEHIGRATATDWKKRTKVDTFNEAVRTQVWLSYYAVRDGAKNTGFLQDYLTGLICSLQLCGEEGEANDLRQEGADS